MEFTSLSGFLPSLNNNKRLSINNDDNLNTYTPTKCHIHQLNSLAHTDDDKENKVVAATDAAATKNLDEAKCKKIKVCRDSPKFLPNIDKILENG